MERRIWITWWIIVYIRYSRLFWTYIKKKNGQKTVNKIYFIHNKIKNRIEFKSTIGYYLELSTPETMKLLGSTKSKIYKDKNGENVAHLEITEVL